MRSSCGPDLGRDEDGVSVPGPWDAVAILYLFDLGTSRCIRSSCCICHPTSTSGTPAQPTSNRLFSLLPWTRLGPTRGHPSSCLCLCFCSCCCCCFFFCCCSCGIKEGLLGCVDWVPVLDAPYGRPSPSHHHPPPKKGLTHPLPPSPAQPSAWYSIFSLVPLPCDIPRLSEGSSLELLRSWGLVWRRSNLKRVQVYFSQVPAAWPLIDLGPTQQPLSCSLLSPHMLFPSLGTLTSSLVSPWLVLLLPLPSTSPASVNLI